MNLHAPIAAAIWKRVQRMIFANIKNMRFKRLKTEDNLCRYSPLCRPYVSGRSACVSAIVIHFGAIPAINPFFESKIGEKPRDLGT